MARKSKPQHFKAERDARIPRHLKGVRREGGPLVSKVPTHGKACRCSRVHASVCVVSNLREVH